jgi:hypothetical protein
MILGALFLVLSTGMVHAQFNSPSNTIGLRFNERENLWVQVNFGPGTGEFLQDGGAVTPTTAPISVTVNYDSLVNRDELNLYAYFASGGPALTNGNGGVVPASDVQATVTNGPVSAFIEESPFSNNSVKLLTSPDVASEGTGNLEVSFSLAITGTNYPAGFYNGTLFLQAQVI